MDQNSLLQSLGLPGSDTRAGSASRSDSDLLGLLDYVNEKMRVTEDRFIPNEAPTTAASVIGYIDNVIAYLEPARTTPRAPWRAADVLPTRIRPIRPVSGPGVGTGAPAPACRRIPDGPVDPAYIERIISELKRLLDARELHARHERATYSRGIREQIRKLRGLGFSDDDIIVAVND